MSDYMTAQFHEKVRELAVLRREMEQLQMENSKLHTECGHLQADLSSLRQELDGVLDMIGDHGPQRCPKSMAAVQAEVRQSRSQVSQPPLTPGETQ